MIEITKEIKKLLRRFDDEQQREILNSAWDACQDVEYLGKCGIEKDLWSGEFEDERIAFELQAIKDVILIYFNDQEEIKKMLTVRIDEDTFSGLKEKCKKNGLKINHIVEKLIEKWILDKNPLL
jgi:hypothetical protein